MFQTRRVSFQNKFEKLVHLVSFIVRKIRGAVKKYPEMWYSTVIVGHMATRT